MTKNRGLELWAGPEAHLPLVCRQPEGLGRARNTAELDYHTPVKKSFHWFLLSNFYPLIHFFPQKYWVRSGYRREAITYLQLLAQVLRVRAGAGLPPSEAHWPDSGWTQSFAGLRALVQYTREDEWHKEREKRLVPAEIWNERWKCKSLLQMAKVTEKKLLNLRLGLEGPLKKKTRIKCPKTETRWLRAEVGSRSTAHPSDKILISLVSESVQFQNESYRFFILSFSMFGTSQTKN